MTGKATGGYKTLFGTQYISYDMIERYGRDVMRDVWTEENKFRAYLKVELLAAEAWKELGVVPAEDIEKLNANASFNIDRIKEIELQTRHDIVAFTRAVSESLGEERKWVHYLSLIQN